MKIPNKLKARLKRFGSHHREPTNREKIRLFVSLFVTIYSSFEVRQYILTTDYAEYEMWLSMLYVMVMFTAMWGLLTLVLIRKTKR